MQAFSRTLAGRTASAARRLANCRVFTTVTRGVDPPPEVAEHGGRTPVDQAARDEESGEKAENGDKVEKQQQQKKEGDEIENEVGLKPNNPGIQSGG